MKTRAHIPFAVLVLLIVAHLPIATALAQGTAFTYQGRLTDGAAPANGAYDMKFTIYDSPSAGLTVGSPLTNSSTVVSNGLFAVTLDFDGNVFTGPARWLEIGVRTNSSAGAYQALSPRQAFTAAPYAITAGNVTGVLPPASLSGGYPGAVSFSNPANTFTGSGAGLTSLNAGQLTGAVPAAALGNAWQIAGNTGANPTNNIFLGTTDNLPLELHVNGRRAFRFEPDTNGAVNIIGGWSNNLIYPIASQAFIGGGGGQSVVSAAILTNIVSDSYGTVAGGLGNIAGNTNNDPTDARGAFVGGGSANQAAGLFSVIAGGQNNYALNAYSFIGGGQGNTNDEYYSVIVGGQNNLIFPLADHSFIGGGQNNSIAGSGGPVYDVIVGGISNSIQSNVSYSVIAGGLNNTIQSNVTYSLIAGGQQNTIQATNSWSVIGGGYNNMMLNGGGNIAGTIAGGYQNSMRGTGAIGGGSFNSIGTGPSCTIAGGYQNIIGDSTYDSTISGGSIHSVGAFSFYCTIGGGRVNNIGGFVTASTIGGGLQNTIEAAANEATIPGGYSNYVAGSFALAAGTQAQATNNGTFVWADPEGTPFSSTDTNQFLIRASGGVGINTNAPSGAALNVAGTVRATSFQGDGSGLLNVNAGAFGNYVFAFNGGAQAVAAGNTFQDLNFSTDAQLKGWTHTGGTSQYTSAQAGLYLVQYYGQFITTLANGTNAQMRVMLNGVEVPGSRSVGTVLSLSEVANLSKSLLVSANAADVLTLQFTGSGTGIRLSGTGNSTLTVTRIQ